MGAMRLSKLSLAMLASVMLLPAAAFAQSAIAGVVRDTTGGVLPGVTVEAASPVLIEQVRTSVTDNAGQYRIADLRPGVYTVTFTLPGFNIVVREGLELPASFTATVNAEMRVGALEETITVSGTAPLVDVQAVTRRNTLPSDVIDSLPVGRSPQNLVALTVGVTNINLGAYSTNVQTQSVQYHGGAGTEAAVSIDGDRVNIAMNPGGSHVTTRINMGMVAEMTYSTAAGSAEAPNTGIQTNLIPREGGNTFSGEVFSRFSSDTFQTSNLTDALRALGLGESRLIKQWDVTPSIGGPLIRDRLWFYGSVRNSAIIHSRPHMFEDSNPTDWVYTPDPTRPSQSRVQDDDFTLRLTWQATQKDKLNFSAGVQPRIQYNWGDENLWTTTATPYATYRPNLVLQAVWKRAATSRLFLEAGGNLYHIFLHTRPQKGFDSSLVGAFEATTGIAFRNNPITLGTGTWGHHDSTTRNFRTSLSYVTGSHNMKVGSNVHLADYGHRRYNVNNYEVHLRNGVPFRVNLTLPWIYHSHVRPDVGLYAQDAWTHKRLTLNLGLRYDYFRGTNNPDDLPASRFAPALSFAGSTGTPVWHDVSPRVGVVIDLFGNNRTALKASLGRYVTTTGTAAAATYNQVNQSVRSANRTWNDANRDFVPDCDFTNPLPNGECGRLSNLNFGTSNPSPLTRDDDVTRGWGVRPFSWEASASVDQELMPGLSVSAAYYRRWFGNFVLTHNTLVGPEDFDPYCITAPVHPRLPGGGGYEVCGLYDIKPSKFGQSQSNVSLAKHFGKQTRVYNGVDLTTSARFPNGVTWSGGLNVGRIETNRCFVIDSPEELRHCNVKPPFQPSFKMYSVIPLPWDVNASVVYQRIPGTELQANYLATSAEIRPSLGRNLSSGATGTVTVPLIEPGTMFADGQQTVDLRLTRIFRVGPGVLRAGVDINNLLNAVDIWRVNPTYGPAWLNPTAFMPGRYVTLSGEFSF